MSTHDAKLPSQPLEDGEPIINLLTSQKEEYDTHTYTPRENVFSI